MEVLVLHPIRTRLLEQLRSAFAVHILPQSPHADEFLTEIAPRIQALIVGVGAPSVDAPLIRRFPKLEIISRVGSGYENIDVACASERRVMVTNAPDSLTEEVADTALGLLLCAVRQLPQADAFLRDGKWLKGTFPLTQTLRDRKCGIVGLGRIGAAIARRLTAMNVPVAYHARRPKPDVPYQHHLSLLGLARDVDVLIVVVPGGSDTERLVDMTILEALGPRGILINVARGSVVDETALITALREKIILGAGLDVYPDEPNVSPDLIAMKHLVLLPHLGSSTIYTRDAMGQTAFDNLIAWRDRKMPLNPVPETAHLVVHGRSRS